MAFVVSQTRHLEPHNRAYIKPFNLQGRIATDLFV